MKSRDESGAVLILALFFALAFGLMAATMAAFATTSVTETGTLKNQRGVVYAADGSIEGALATIFSAFKANPTATPACPTSDTPQPVFSYTTPEGIRGQAQCTGSLTVNGESNPNAVPPWAITTLNGGRVNVKGKGSLSIGAGPSGSIWSSSTITVGKGTTVTSAGANQAVKCSAGPGPGGGGTLTPACTTAPAPPDPGYSASVGSVPTNVIPDSSLPTTCPTAVVHLSPGVYQDAVALSNMMNGKKNNPCAGHTFVFDPGVYLLYFTNAPGSHTWTINDTKARIVAGTPSAGWSALPPIPGGCDLTKPGVTFVIAGNSQLNVAAGRFELCPPLSAGGATAAAQRVSVYGPTAAGANYAPQQGALLKVGNRATVVVNGTVYAPKGDVNLDTSQAFTPPLARGVVCRNLNLKASRYGLTAVTVTPVPPNAGVILSVDVTGLAAQGSAALSPISTAHLTFTKPPGATAIPTVRVDAWEAYR